MTIKDIEIKSGPELDRAVALAIGWHAPRKHTRHEGRIPPCPQFEDYFNPPPEVEEWRSDYHWRRKGKGPCYARLPNYSSDLNAAIEAAEKVFDSGFALHTAGKPVGGWKMFRCIVGVGWKDHECESQFEEHAETPALAICAAILKLKGNDL